VQKFCAAAAESTIQWEIQRVQKGQEDGVGKRVAKKEVRVNLCLLLFVDLPKLFAKMVEI